MGTTASGATLRLWDLLARPVDPTEALHLLFGLDVDAAKHEAARALLADPAVRRALDVAPALLRRPRSVDNTKINVAVGAVTGQIDWHRTVVARASAGFPDDIFVCSTYERTLDVAENRLLAATLQRWASAGLDLVPASRFDDEELRQCRAAARTARELLSHPVLARVNCDRQDRRALTKVRHGARRSRYRAVTEAAARSTDHLDQTMLDRILDRRTQVLHEVLVAVLDLAASHGWSRELHVRGADLVAGPVVFRHPGERGGRRPGGLRVGTLLLDVPAVLERPELGRPSDDRLVVTGSADVDRYQGVITARLRDRTAQRTTS